MQQEVDVIDMRQLGEEAQLNGGAPDAPRHIKAMTAAEAKLRQRPELDTLFVDQIKMNLVTIDVSTLTSCRPFDCKQRADTAMKDSPQARSFYDAVLALWLLYASGYFYTTAARTARASQCAPGRPGPWAGLCSKT